MKVISIACLIACLMFAACSADYLPLCQDLPKDMEGPNKTKLFVSKTDELSRQLVQSFAIEVNALAHYPFIVLDSSNLRAFAIYTSTAELARIANESDRPAVGVCEEGAVYVMEPGQSYEFAPKGSTGPTGPVTLPEKYVKIVLAHEIGHAMGLVHVDHGLMYPSVNPACEDVEAKCLIEALQDQGKL